MSFQASLKRLNSFLVELKEIRGTLTATGLGITYGAYKLGVKWDALNKEVEKERELRQALERSVDGKVADRMLQFGFHPDFTKLQGVPQSFTNC
ncbi:hypothetical protein HDV00_002195 [Rhizophlyctis rosea]|nr:hypothetical protein HDV00_002195 [Rhizophlyctis rosea]